MKRAIAGLLGCVVVAVGGGVGAGHDGKPEQFGPWSAPVNLGAVVNSSVRDTAGSISRDGLSLYFSSSRTVANGPDLFVSRRLAVDLPWGTPSPLEMLNSPLNDGGPSLSSDNRFLFFYSGRAGSGLDLWVSQRRHKHDDFGWEPPVMLPSPPNSPGTDVAPAYVEDPGRKRQLYFSSGPTPPGLDIYVTELLKDGTWSDPENLVVLNSAFEDSGSAVRFDGLEMIFSSRRGGDLDMYVTRRNHRWEPWLPPENLGAVVNTASQEFSAHLSANGRTLYFASDRPGGFGNFDLYASTRSRLRGSSNHRD
jgi:Tol biopolymer transport system component